jgi:hypothetical protein
MSKVSKITTNRFVNSHSQKINKAIEKNMKRTNAINMSSLSKSLLCLSMLGAVMVQSCEPASFVEDITIVDGSVGLDSKLDKALNSLNILVEPHTSINDIKTFSFNSDKKEQFFFQN